MAATSRLEVSFAAAMDKEVGSQRSSPVHSPSAEARRRIEGQEVMCDDDILILRRALENERIISDTLRQDLEYEREGAESAAQASMSMIQKLQKEKALASMEATQATQKARITIEKAIHDEEAMKLMTTIITKQQHELLALGIGVAISEPRLLLNGSLSKNHTTSIGSPPPRSVACLLDREGLTLSRGNLVIPFDDLTSTDSFTINAREVAAFETEMPSCGGDTQQEGIYFVKDSMKGELPDIQDTQRLLKSSIIHDSDSFSRVESMQAIALELGVIHKEGYLGGATSYCEDVEDEVTRNKYGRADCDLGNEDEVKSSAVAKLHAEAADTNRIESTVEAAVKLACCDSGLVKRDDFTVNVESEYGDSERLGNIYSIKLQEICPAYDSEKKMQLQREETRKDQRRVSVNLDRDNSLKDHAILDPSYNKKTNPNMADEITKTEVVPGTQPTLNHEQGIREEGDKCCTTLQVGSLRESGNSCFPALLIELQEEELSNSREEKKNESPDCLEEEFFPIQLEETSHIYSPNAGGRAVSLPLSGAVVYQGENDRTNIVDVTSKDFSEREVIELKYAGNAGVENVSKEHKMPGIGGNIRSLVKKFEMEAAKKVTAKQLIAEKGGGERLARGAFSRQPSSPSLGGTWALRNISETNWLASQFSYGSRNEKGVNRLRESSCERDKKRGHESDSNDIAKGQQGKRRDLFKAKGSLPQRGSTWAMGKENVVNGEDHKILGLESGGVAVAGISQTSGQVAAITNDVDMGNNDQQEVEESGREGKTVFEMSEPPTATQVGGNMSVNVS